VSSAKRRRYSIAVGSLPTWEGSCAALADSICIARRP
jgi:hypothetical protein